jgi:hypothetical protein
MAAVERLGAETTRSWWLCAYRRGMSDVGPASPAPDPAQPTDDASPRRKRWLLPALALVVLAAAAGVGAFIVLRGDDEKHSYPKEWDARIKPYVEIVEDERGLAFEHPVKVRFLDKKAFEKTVRTDKEDLDKDDRREIKEETALFRAFGLISGDVDLFEAFNDAHGSGTLAYYSFDDRAITVRGKKLTLASRATLVHELTHALQDQRFNISDRSKKLAKKAEDGKPTTEGDALRAIVEGDAERVADLYRASLSKKERTALEKAESADSEGSLDELKGVPKVVLTLMGAPYALGQALTETVAAKDDDHIDELLQDPPPDDSVLLDPLKALGDIRDSADVKIPKLADGEKKFDSGQLGTLVTYLMLAERIPLKEALAAADTWRGDAYLGFKRKNVLCARVDYATSSNKAAARLTSAFEDWIADQPGSSATISSEGDRVTFESCDPGKGAKLANDASEDALRLVATRSYLGASGIKAGASVKAARCFSSRMIDEFSIANLNDPTFGANDPAVIKRVQGIAAGCR